MQKKIVFGATLLLINLALLEITSYVVGNWFIPNRLIFNPHFDTETENSKTALYELYVKARNPQTGWPLKMPYQTETAENRWFRFDAAGRRISPAFSDDTLTACVSLFGDSFTFSSEVDDEFAWGNRLAEKLDCPVSNYGVGGFGSDQAYIRYITKNERTPVVFLNHLSENVMRNVTQFRALIIGYDNVKGIALPVKPRFYLDENNQLQLAGLPAIETDDYIDFLYKPEDYLTHEYFLPGGDSGINRLSFPYTWTLLKLVNHFHIKAILQGKPWYMSFYEEDHKSNGLQITAGFMLDFIDLAKERKQAPVITIIPTGPDLIYFLEHGTWPYQNLIEYLQVRDVKVLNFGTGLISRIDGRDPCSLFFECNSHFNENGYGYLAEIAYEYIQSEGLLKDPGTG